MWPSGKDRHGVTGRQSRGEGVRAEDSGGEYRLQCSYCPSKFQVLGLLFLESFQKEKGKRERNKKREKYDFTDFKGTDLSICSSKEKMVCVSQSHWSQ